MGKFGHFKSYKADGDKALPFVISFRDVSFRIFARPATEANKPYWNFIMRKVEENQQRGGAVALNASTTSEARLKDAEAFAEFCVDGWDQEIGDGLLPLLDNDGAPVPFSKDEAAELLRELAINVRPAFDAFRTWVTNETNFMPGKVKAEGSALGK